MEELQIGELVALSFNAGITMALVQVLKLKLLPVLKTKFPFAIPIVASVLGLAASYVLAATGIDISPIAGLFSGLASSGAFAVVKEISNP